MLSESRKFFHSWANETLPKSIGHSRECKAVELKQRLLLLHEKLIIWRRKVFTVRAMIYEVCNICANHHTPTPSTYLFRSSLSWSRPINMTVFATSWTTLFLPSTSCTSSSSMPVWVPNCKHCRWEHTQSCIIRADSSVKFKRCRVRNVPAFNALILIKEC